MALKTKEEYNAYMRQYQMNRYYERRAMFIAELGGVCVQCGTTELLEFDHINPEEKSFNVGDRLSNRSEAVLRVEIAKCQLLCGPCHKEKSDSYKSVGHGEGITGKKNCRCEKCAPLKNAYARELKRRKREESAKNEF